MENISTLETLEAWLKTRKLRIRISKLTKNLPSIEKFRLTDQLIRASRSVTANIAEGYGRFHYKEGVQYYRISRGSLYELKDHLISCFDLRFIDQERFKQGIDLIESAKLTINGFINYVKNKI